jgi:uncharacterized membrane protein
MANPLSLLGIVHTLVSVPPIVFGVWAFVRDGRIDPGTRVGKAYVASMVTSVVTSFGLSSTGGFNPGHALGLVALLLMAVGAMSVFGRATEYVRTLTYSASFMVLLVPGINETLTRLPADKPLADSPQSPLVQAALAALLGLFLCGATYQVLRLRGRAYGHVGGLPQR